VTPVRLCADPSCPDPSTYRGRCQRHARQREKQTSRAGHKIYRSRRWARTREKYLSQNPLCECDDPACREIATDVHHRVDIAAGGEPWSFKNLQALCHSHHSQITRQRL
jgi:5-methylcytosine-specific restriction protein A